MLTREENGGCHPTPGQGPLRLLHRQRGRQRSATKHSPNLALTVAGCTSLWPLVPLGHVRLSETGEFAQASQKIDLTQPYRPRGASTTRLTTATAGLMSWSGWFGRNMATNQICSIVGGPVATCSSTEGS